MAEPSRPLLPHDQFPRFPSLPRLERAQCPLSSGGHLTFPPPPPSRSESGAPFALVINLIIPGTPLLSLVATFVTDRDCFALAASSPPEDPMDGKHGWTPFDFVLHRWEGEGGRQAWLDTLCAVRVPLKGGGGRGGALMPLLSGKTQGEAMLP